jgi:uncharacterized membrane protein (DUF2068 family)
MDSRSNKNVARVAERGIATVEFLKGLAVVLIGAGFATMMHRDYDLDDVAVNLLYVLHLTNHHRISAIFFRAADKLEDANLVLIAVCASVYVVIRFVEAYGLWNGRAWAEWLALISGCLYLPLEIYELFRRPTSFRFAIFLVNVLVVAYMAWLRWTAHKRRAERYEGIGTETESPA